MAPFQRSTVELLYVTTPAVVPPVNLAFWRTAVLALVAAIPRAAPFTVALAIRVPVVAFKFTPRLPPVTVSPSRVTKELATRRSPVPLESEREAPLIVALSQPSTL